INAAAAAKDRRTSRKAFYNGLQSYVQNLFTDPNVVAQFGFTPRKTATQDTATKSLAVQKRAATRKARHTMGKNQKAGVHGTVPSAAPVASGTQAPQATPPTPASPTPAVVPSPGGTPQTPVGPEPVTPAPVTPAPAAGH
ncbi:MAG TPA: hypothetical protein VMI31_04500, partial [Fimbriimonadaceae bacterium]|nr:hypothetical protein [Fimbriimonadaceae bacterium]